MFGAESWCYTNGASDSARLVTITAERWPRGLRRRFAKTNPLLCYLIQNPTKSLCQPSDSVIFNFLEFADFCLFCTGFSDNLVTVSVYSFSQT
jgi:hypothetical protein